MNTDNVLVSIVVPIYNAERYLSKCIQSISEQSYENIEIILLNYGSIDNSLRICNEHLLRDARIRMTSRESSGEAATRNLGIEIARGKYICFINSDDIIEKEYIEKLVCNVEEKTLTFCGYKIDSYCDIKDTSVTKIYRNLREFYVKDNITDVFHKGFLSVVWNKIYDMEILKNNNLKFDEDINFGEDLVFNLEYLKLGIEKFKSVSAPLYHYIWRQRGRLQNKSKMDFLKIYEGPFDKLLDMSALLGVPDKKKSVLYRDYMDGMIASADDYYRFCQQNNTDQMQLNKMMENMCENIEKEGIIENTAGIDRLICRCRLYLLKSKKLNVDYYIRSVRKKMMEL